MSTWLILIIWRAFGIPGQTHSLSTFTSYNYFIVYMYTHQSSNKVLYTTIVSEVSSPSDFFLPLGSKSSCARNIHTADSQPSAILIWKTLENHSDLGRTPHILKANRKPGAQCYRLNLLTGTCDPFIASSKHFLFSQYGHATRGQTG